MTYPSPMLQRRLHRNTTNKGVGALLFVGGSFLLPGPQWVLYVLAWIIMPPN